jgi:2-dehydro-3-deoxyphosphogluconate aldolase / (4S)-4-hydroxy-2-oxoglutarate aldolase
MTGELTRALRRLQIVPVIVIDDAADALPLADALIQGGLPCAEITFRTAGAAEALRCIAAERPDLLVGAGTVLTAEQAAKARSAGAKFIVSPGLHPRVIDYCLEHDLPVYPGICTPTEVAAALEKGLRVVKFFPAEPMGGLPFLKAIAAPFGEMEFMPTGGVTAALLAAYLGFKKVVACGGSWMAPTEWIAAKQFDRIREETMRATALARATRGDAT